jgi:hypothetical protein
MVLAASQRRRVIWCSRSPLAVAAVDDPSLTQGHVPSLEDLIDAKEHYERDG